MPHYALFGAAATPADCLHAARPALAGSVGNATEADVAETEAAGKWFMGVWVSVPWVGGSSCLAVSQ